MVRSLHLHPSKPFSATGGLYPSNLDVELPVHRRRREEAACAARDCERREQQLAAELHATVAAVVRESQHESARLQSLLTAALAA